MYPKAYSYFRWFWDYAGGHITDSGVHMIDILQMAFGEAMPKAVTALGGNLWFKDNRETPDTMQVTYEYPGFTGSWEHRCNNADAGTCTAHGCLILRESRDALRGSEPLPGDSREGI